MIDSWLIPQIGIYSNWIPSGFIQVSMYRLTIQLIDSFKDARMVSLENFHPGMKPAQDGFAGKFPSWDEARPKAQP